MNQNIRKTIAIGLITCLLSLLCGFSSAFADADNGCTLQISFDKTEYKTGDAAKVTVKLSDVADEIAAGRKLGAFELHIFYESEALSFQGAALNETVKAAADATVAQPAELDSENIVLAFSALDGVEVTEGMTLAEVSFRILAPGGSTVSVTVPTGEGADFAPAAAEPTDGKLVLWSCATDMSAASARVVADTPDIPDTPVTPGNPSRPGAVHPGGILPGMITGSYDVPFTDVAETDWFADAVEYVYDSGLMNGTASDRFSPGLDVTRGMFAAIVHRMEGQPDFGFSDFTDIQDTDYYSKPVAWARIHGVVLGISDTEYAPQVTITREQMAAILHRYVTYKGVFTPTDGDLSIFTDGDNVEPYAMEPVRWAVRVGLIQGKGNGILDPGAFTTRAEMAVVLQRFCENPAFSAVIAH